MSILKDIKNVELIGNEAVMLSDLTGIQIDLGDVVEYCDKFLEERDGNKDYIILSALNEAALVKYARCFVDGVRHRLKPEDYFDDESLLEEHRWFYLLRNRHAAHSVNSFERGQVNAAIRSVEEGYLEVSEISVQTAKIAMLNIRRIKKLKLLSMHLLDKVGEKIKLENKLMHNNIKKIPIENLIKSAVKHHEPLKNVHKRRTK